MGQGRAKNREVVYDEKGYGFIGRESGRQVFVNEAGIASEGRRLRYAEDRITFDAERLKGLQAKNVVRF